MREARDILSTMNELQSVSARLRRARSSLRLHRSTSRDHSRSRASDGDGDDSEADDAWRSVTGVLSHRGSVNSLRPPAGVKSPILNGSHSPYSAEPQSYAEEADEISDGEDYDLLPKETVSRPAEESSWIQRMAHRIRHPPALTRVQRNILKCSTSYFLASLFTFVDPLSDMLTDAFELEGPVANAHFVATIAVYFNPAKGRGEMIEADLFLVCAGLFSLIVCFGSMATAVALNLENVEWLSHIVVVVVWLAGSNAIIAFCKNRVGKSTFSSACSMTALINSVIICKEGAVHLKLFELDAIVQMSLIVAIGAAISNLVCYTLWPESNTTKLQDSVSKTLSAFAELIQLLSRTFLLDEDAPLRDDKVLKSAVETHQQAFTELKTALSAAKLELLDPRISGSHEAYDDIVSAMERLAQHTSGLRSGCSLQNRLQQAKRSGTLIWPLSDDQLKSETLYNGISDQRLRDGAKTFVEFKEHVGPSLRKLTTECKNAFKQLRLSFLGYREDHPGLQRDVESGGNAAAVLEKIKYDLTAALATFERDHNRTLKRLYKHNPAKVSKVNEFDGLEGTEPALDLSKAVNEAIFEVYFFFFNLEEFVHELIHLVDAFVLIRAKEDQLEALQAMRKQKYGRLANVAAALGIGGPAPIWGAIRYKVAVLVARFATLLPFKRKESPFPAAVDNIKSRWSQRQHLRFLQRQQRKLWQWLQKRKNPDVLFSIKVGVGAGMLGAPAFFEPTRATWVLYRGEWAMISYMVVVATTLGQTNFNLLFRVVGTIAGALVAIVAYQLLAAYPVLLAIFGFFFSIPCFWLVVTKPMFATTGRFVLLAYNLTALYAYNLREQDLRIHYVAFRRSVAVAVGSVWAWAVIALIWRYEARKEFRNGMSELLLNSAWLYEKLVKAYSTPPKEMTRIASSKHLDNESTMLLTPAARRHLSSTIEDFVQLELHLQRQLIHLKSLLNAAQLEWRMQGPFPTSIYRGQIANAQSILDQLHAMRCVTTREAWYTIVRRQFIIPVQKERRAMVGNILLYFALLSSAIRLMAPLPPFMPPAEEARLSLMAKIRELPVVKRRTVQRADSLIYFAYAAVMEDVIRELLELGRSCQELYGVLGDRAENDFEDLFRWQDEEEGDAPSPAMSSDDDE